LASLQNGWQVDVGIQLQNSTGADMDTTGIPPG